MENIKLKYLKTNPDEFRQEQIAYLKRINELQLQELAKLDDKIAEHYAMNRPKKLIRKNGSQYVTEVKSSGKKKFDGLYDKEIEEMMAPLDKYGFMGVYMADEIANIDKKRLQKLGSLIMNDEPAIDPKSGKPNPGQHWLGLFYDVSHPLGGGYNLYFEKNQHAQSCYYYDSFGRQPSEEMRKKIDDLIEKVKDKFDLKDSIIDFDWNNKREQPDSSMNCGYFSMLWIVKMYKAHLSGDLRKEFESVFPTNEDVLAFKEDPERLIDAVAAKLKHMTTNKDGKKSGALHEIRFPKSKYSKNECFKYLDKYKYEPIEEVIGSGTKYRFKISNRGKGKCIGWEDPMSNIEFIIERFPEIVQPTS